MEFRLWIGLWTSFFLFLLVAFNLSFLVKYITPFTEDCFATLVAIIFIIDALKSTYNLRHGKKLPVLISNDTDEDYNQTTPMSQLEMDYLKSKTNAEFYFSVVLFVLTFSVCMTLKAFRNKPYLPSNVNQVLLFYLN